MPRLRLLVAYRGTDFSGWQIQERPKAPPTIQGSLEKALATIAGAPVRVTGAGRTDAGVHAFGQVAHCDIPEGCSPDTMMRSLNALLPADVRVLDVSPVAFHFHARKNALRKTYFYQFWQDEGPPPPQLAPYVWACRPLDIESMRTAVQLFMGEKDFSALQNRGADTSCTVRHVLASDLLLMPQQEFWPAHRPMLRLTVTANGFLKQMVRNMAGALWAIGLGKLTQPELSAMLASGRRQALASPTAPASGLTLARVYY